MKLSTLFVARETRMPKTFLTSAWDRGGAASPSFAQLMLWFLSLGFLSGLASGFMPPSLSDIQLFDTPVFPGIIFGAALACAFFRWGGAGWTAFLILPIVTTCAWIASVQLFQALSVSAYSFHGEAADQKINPYFGALIAGALGAAGTFSGCALIDKSLRRWTLILSVALIGALAGLLVVPVLDHSEMIVLFVPWQALVAASIGYAVWRSARP